MGSTLFAAFMVGLNNMLMWKYNEFKYELLLSALTSLPSFLQHKPDTLYMNMDETQAELLLNNKVNVRDGGDESMLTVLKS